MDALNKGRPAPDVPLQDARGAAIRLSQLWRDQPLVLVFLRHFG